MFNIKAKISKQSNPIDPGRYALERNTSLSADPFYDMIVEKKPFTVEFCVIYVVTFMDICADMGDYCEEVVGTISIIGFIGCVGV